MRLSVVPRAKRQRLSCRLVLQLMLRTAIVQQHTMRLALSLASLRSQLQFQSPRLLKLLLLIRCLWPWVRLNGLALCYIIITFISHNNLLYIYLSPLQSGREVTITRIILLLDCAPFFNSYFAPSRRATRRQCNLDFEKDLSKTRNSSPNLFIW